LIPAALCLSALLGCEEDEDMTGPDDHEFQFATDPVSAYTRVDRMGMPAVATAAISSAQKDAYNAADPTDDVAGQFVADITTNVTALHTALDDDLTGLGLTPCDASDCVGQAAPLVVPDELAIDIATPSGFPNGRRLTDQVIDITLAVLLLDLGTHGVRTFADLPVNPPAGDASFTATFPFLAPPHVPATLRSF
jgi:hypothetical protein